MTTPLPPASAAAFSSSLSTVHPYELPVWAKDAFTSPPRHGRLRLAHLPTPIYPITTLQTNDDDDENANPSLARLLHDLSLTLFVKRDDSTGGIELGGNKIRKLEFLLAEALHENCDAIVTIGGIQSNHCRATAAASAMLGLVPHLILRCSKIGKDKKPPISTNDSGGGQREKEEGNDEDDDELGTVGNLLFDRLVGSRIYTVTTGEYGRIGSTQLVRRLCQHLRSISRPYAIPVGGSNGLGSFGYIEAVDEVMTQWRHMFPNDDSINIDHIFLACGSGGKAAGVAVGMALYHRYYYSNRRGPHVHAMAVCDDPEYFYNFVTDIVTEMGLVVPPNDNDNDDSVVVNSVQDYVRSCLTVHQCKGQGYAVSTSDELQFLADFARQSGIVLDPVYTGKALYGFYQLLRDNPDQFRGGDGGGRILFWHTGGALGLYDKSPDLHPFLRTATSSSSSQQQRRQITRLDVYGKGNGGLDVSAPVE
jgi:D-cysteine desulfhydrase